MYLWNENTNDARCSLHRVYTSSIFKDHTFVVPSFIWNSVRAKFQISHLRYFDLNAKEQKHDGEGAMVAWLLRHRVFAIAIVFSHPLSFVLSLICHRVFAIAIVFPLPLSIAPLLYRSFAIVFSLLHSFGFRSNNSNRIPYL